MTHQSSLIALLEPLGPDLELVQRILDDQLAHVAQPFQAALQSRVAGGKRLRSALVLWTARLFGAPSAPFYTLGAAVEMLHAATLIHDDVVDDSPVRRGRAALHTIWPTAATVLVGDYLLAHSVMLAAGLNHPAILHVLADTLATMCRGEMEQVFTESGRSLRREHYYRSIEAKTASLFAAAVQMAAMLAGAADAQVAALRRYGRELGMAYQVVDDVLDVVADEKELGKAAGSDLRQGLLTLPILLHLQGGTDDCPVRAVLAGQRDEEHVQAAIQAIRSSGAVTAALAEAQVYARQAQQALLALPDTPARHTLATLAEATVVRRQ